LHHLRRLLTGFFEVGNEFKTASELPVAGSIDEWSRPEADISASRVTNTFTLALLSKP
jgi:hypothetical protein